MKYIGIDWKKKLTIKEVIAKHIESAKLGYIPKKLVKELTK